jgi:hypothetical protein
MWYGLTSTSYERPGRDRLFSLVMLLLAAQAVLRLIFFVASFSIDFVDEEVSDAVMSVTNALFLVLGVAGLLFLYPLAKRERIGYLGTLGVCAATIAFDIWGIFAVQPSAAMGMVVPVVAIAYLIWKREYFQGSKTPTAHG